MARVLVVDDHEDSRDLIAAMLAPAHEALLAADGDEALAILGREPVDVAVVDIYMPGKDGIAVIREVRRTFPRVKVVAISAGWGAQQTLSFDVLAQARALGAEGALPKPLMRNALLALVEGLVEPVS
jgi:CheY-like chemotaxis protein